MHVSHPHRQAGHAPLELDELTDVDQNGLIPQVGQQTNRLRAVIRDEETIPAEMNDMRTRLLGHRHETGKHRHIIDQRRIPDDGAVR